MPRQKSLVTVIRDIVRREIAEAMQALLSVAAPTKRKRRTKNGRRRKRRGPGRGIQQQSRPTKARPR
jgi:hypothetical protein